MNKFVLIAGEYINIQKIESLLIKKNIQEGVSDNWVVKCFLKNSFSFERILKDDTENFLSKLVTLAQKGFSNLESAEFWIDNNFDSIRLQENKFVIKDSVNSLLIGMDDSTQKYHVLLIMDSIERVNKKEENYLLSYEVVPNVLLSQSFEYKEEANNWILNNFNNLGESLSNKKFLSNTGRVLQ